LQEEAGKQRETKERGRRLLKKTRHSHLVGLRGDRKKKIFLREQEGIS